jgi:PPOX class probable F420-dependent enzyme
VLVTVARDGRPRPVPIVFVVDPSPGPEGVLRITTPIDEKPKRSTDSRDLARVRDIAERPLVAVLVDRWNEDWSRLGWLRLSGTASLLEPGAERHGTAVERLREKYPQYARQRLEERPMIEIAVERIVGWGDLGGD